MKASFHLICNAHLDPVWMWAWEEGAAEAVATFRTAAELCESHDGFVFNHNEAVLYEWVRQYEPGLFARIQRLVKEGRWHIMGGWYLQPDCNMPCGEALIRQVQRGRAYFAQHFGVRPRTAINFDPFGHSRGLVQIMAKCGYDSYIFGRPTPPELPLPGEAFVWRGFDGSRIVARRFPGWYNTPLGQARRHVQERMAACLKNGDVCAPILWGVGNHGGGPSRKDLAEINAVLQSPEGAAARHSTPEAFFDELRARGARLPEHAGDINPWGTGCYTSQVRVKQQYRALENELFVTEKMASAAAVQTLMPYPAEALASAERGMVWNQFHDILPGSSAPVVEEDTLRSIAHAREELAHARAHAFFALASGVPAARAGAIPVLVYNPHPYPLTAVIESEFQLPDISIEETFFDVAVYHGRRRVPAQVEQEATNLNAEWRKRIVFRARLQPSQMMRFDCVPQPRPAAPAAPSPAPPSRHVTVRSNDTVARVNGATGVLERWETGGRAVLAAPVEFVVYADNDDPWGMAGRALGGARLGAFRLMTPAEAAQFAGVAARRLAPVRVIEDGPVRTVVEALLCFRSSRICVRYIMPKHGAELGVHCRVQWNEPHRLLRAEFPTRLRRGAYCGQTVFGIQPLPVNNDEAVAQRWTALYDKQHGTAVTWCTDSGYGSRCKDGVVALTLLRSPAYAGHPIGNRPITPQDRFTPRIDTGVREFTIRMQAGPLRRRMDEIELDALRHNEPPVALAFSPPGSGAPLPPFVLLDNRAVRITAMKQSADGQALIMRLFEPRGRACRATLRLPAFGITHRVALAPFEVKTFSIRQDTKSVSEVSMLEEPLPQCR